MLYRIDTGERLLTEREARRAAEAERLAAERVRQVEAAARQAAEADWATIGWYQFDGRRADR